MLIIETEAAAKKEKPEAEEKPKPAARKEMAEAEEEQNLSVRKLRLRSVKRHLRK